MLKNFKNTKSAKRAANVKMQRAKDMEIKKVHAPHGQSKEESPPSTDTEVSDSSSDSDYEEILISSLRKSKPEPPVVPEPHDESNHSNHFTEEQSAKPAKQAEPKPSNAVRTKPKQKRKKVVIKKYYQQRQPPQPVEQAPARASYIGLGGMGSDTTATTMRSRLMNW